MSKAPPLSPKSRRDTTTAETHLSTTSPTTSRPPLQRLPASDAPYQAQKSHTVSRDPPQRRDHGTTDTDMSEDDGALSEGGAAATGSRGPEAPSQDRASPDELEIERLRSLQLKVLQQQQRARLRSIQNTATPATKITTSSLILNLLVKRLLSLILSIAFLFHLTRE